MLDCFFIIDALNELKLYHQLHHAAGSARRLKKSSTSAGKKKCLKLNASVKFETSHVNDAVAYLQPVRHRFIFHFCDRWQTC